MLRMAFLKIYQARMSQRDPFGLESRFLIPTKSPCPPEEVGTSSLEGGIPLSDIFVCNQ